MDVWHPAYRYDGCCIPASLQQTKSVGKTGLKNWTSAFSGLACIWHLCCVLLYMYCTLKWGKMNRSWVHIAVFLTGTFQMGNIFWATGKSRLVLVMNPTKIQICTIQNDTSMENKVIGFLPDGHRQWKWLNFCMFNNEI